MTDVLERIQRIYAALDEVITRDPAQFGATSTPRPWGLSVDFSGGLSPAQLQNRAMQVVYLVAHLPDHLRAWAKHRGLDPNQIDNAVSSSEELKILIDLSDADKHGGERRDRGRSGLGPRLRGVARALRLEGGSPASITVTVRGSGAELTEVESNFAAEISGEVVDAAGTHIGDLMQLVTTGLSTLESLLSRLQAEEGELRP